MTDQTPAPSNNDRDDNSNDSLRDQVERAVEHATARLTAAAPWLAEQAERQAPQDGPGAAQERPRSKDEYLSTLGPQEGAWRAVGVPWVTVRVGGASYSIPTAGLPCRWCRWLDPLGACRACVANVHMLTNRWDNPTGSRYLPVPFTT